MSALAGLFCSLSLAATPNWTFDKYIQVPYRNTLFLAADHQGNLYCTTFNNSAQADTIVALKVSEPAGPSPKTSTIDQAQVPAFRGYSGIAVDHADNVYLAVDKGNESPSYIKKLLPSGQADPAFGQKGVLPGNSVRFQGLAASGDRLIAAESWGRIAVLDARTGRKLGESPALPDSAQQPTIRDIALVPSTQEILGVDRDSVFVFTGGTLESPSAYTLQPLIQGTGKLTAGQGICYQPESDRIYYARPGLGHLASALKSNPKPEVVESVGTWPGGPLSEPADAVASQDGQLLFVSDLRAPVIMCYRSGSAGSQLAATPQRGATSGGAIEPVPGGGIFFGSSVATTSNTVASASTIAPLNGKPLEVAGGGASDGTPKGGMSQASDGTLGTAAAINWETGDLRRALSKAYSSKRRLVAFFTDSQAQLANQVESEIFDSPGFAQSYPDALFLRLTLGVDRADVERYGVFRVPTVIIFSSVGQEIARLSGYITREEFAKAYASTTDQIKQ